MNIIELAKEACAPNQTFNSDPEWVERFAALVRAEEQMKALEAARTIGGDWAVLFEREYLK